MLQQFNDIINTFRGKVYYKKEYISVLELYSKKLSPKYRQHPASCVRYYFYYYI